MPALPWISSLAVTFIAFLSEAAKGIVGRVLVALGFGLVTMVGINTAIDAVMKDALDFSGAGNSQFYAALDAMSVPWFISTLISAVSTRMTLRGLTSEGLSFWIMRKRIG